MSWGRGSIKLSGAALFGVAVALLFILGAMEARGGYPAWADATSPYERAPAVIADSEQIFLGPYLEYLEDPDGSYDVSDVTSPPLKGRFRRSRQVSPGFGFTSSVYWFRFSIKNPSDGERLRFLEIEYPLLDYIELYIPDGRGGFKVYDEGDRRPFYDRPIPYRNFVFILDIPPGESMSCLLRVKTSSSLNLPARLYSEAGFIDKVESEETALGIYFGILFAMLAYNLILFFTIRESVYLYYVLFVIFYFLFQLDLTGVAFKYLWPEAIGWANNSLPFFIFVAFLFGTMFTRKILNSREYAPFLDKILQFYLIVTALSAASCLFLPYEVSIKAATLVTTTVFVHIFTGFLCLYRGWRPARYYALAWTISMAGAAIYALKSFGVLPNNFVTVWGIQIGSAWEVILLSMALSDRLSLLQKEKDRIQAEYTRKLEAANIRLEEFTRTLEEKVRQRTRELEESNALLQKQAREMRLAEERAERASKAKSDFLANMSHEIRTPLNAITGITALALDMELPHKLRDYLKVIRVSANSLLNLVNDILDFSKIEAGKMELEDTDFSLQEVIENVAEMFTELSSDKGIDFIIHLDSDLPLGLRGDPVRLGQLLTNFVSNAVKFTERGRVILRCSLLEREGKSARISFAVSDTGIGIEKERLDDLFHMFTQADSSTTRRFGGTGLGLTICKRIAQLMGGEIEVASEPGRGTTFTFTVCLETAPSEGTEEERLPAVRQLRAVLLSDSPESAAAIEEIAERLGIRGPVRLRLGQPLSTVEHLDAPSSLCLVDLPGQDLDKVAGLAPLLERCAGARFVLIAPFGAEQEIRGALQGLGSQKGGLCLVPRPCTISRLKRALEMAPDFSTLTDGLEKEAVPSGFGPRFSGLRVLVVEDNEINQLVAREILERCGVSVEFASNGIEALERVHDGIDLVFMDIQMPEMDGYEATRRLRKRHDLKDLPIIAMTAGVFKEDRQRCFEAGMNDFLMKPVTPDSVHAVLVKWVDPAKVSYGPPERDEEKGTVRAGAIEIPGADMKEVANRFGHDLSLYLELLSKFVDECQGLPAKVEGMVARDRSRQQGGDELRRLFHTMKGVAANLALGKLRELFLQAEKEAAGGGRDFSSHLAAISQQVMRITEALKEVPGPVDRMDGGETEDKSNYSELKNIILKLDELLELNDIECETLWADLRKRLTDIVPEDDLSEIDSLISELEFEYARDKLADITTRLQN
jgi:signal transduction histidine kinase/CheY-like chemotaxis protein